MVSDTRCILRLRCGPFFIHNLEYLKRNNIRQINPLPEYGAEICRRFGVRHPKGWCQAPRWAWCPTWLKPTFDNRRPTPAQRLVGLPYQRLAVVSDTFCILHFATMVRTRFNHNLESLRRNNVRQTKSPPEYGAEICRYHGVRHPTGWCQALRWAWCPVWPNPTFDNRRPTTAQRLPTTRSWLSLVELAVEC